MVEIYNRIIKELGPNNNCQANGLNYYPLDSKRYITFLSDEINKANIENILNKVKDGCKSISNSKWNTVIVIGFTTEKFSRNELLFFDGIDTFVVFYLINMLNKEIYMDKQGIFAPGLNYRKYIKKINKILCSQDMQY